MKLADCAKLQNKTFLCAASSLHLGSKLAVTNIIYPYWWDYMDLWSFMKVGKQSTIIRLNKTNCKSNLNKIYHLNIYRKPSRRETHFLTKLILCFHQGNNLRCNSPHTEEISRQTYKLSHPSKQTLKKQFKIRLAVCITLHCHQYHHEGNGNTHMNHQSKT